MKNLFLDILTNYKNAKTDIYKDNKVAVLVRNGANVVASNSSIIDSEKYLIKGSAGEGKWADIPWIAILDKEITETATKGYYIVYLFCADMSGMYLSLNQGWTDYKNIYGAKQGAVKINQVKSEWQRKISLDSTEFSFENIDLMNEKNGYTRARGYELGHICGKYYSVNNIPDNTVLLRDLNSILGVYRELKGNLKGNSVQKKNESLIANATIGLSKRKNPINDLNNFDQFIAHNDSKCIKNQPKIKYVDGGKLPDFQSKAKKITSSGPKKINYLDRAVTQIKTGFVGELMIINYEIEYLISNNRRVLAEKVRHVAKENDRLGYDILSFDLDGNEKYIEVKTTKNDREEPFYITPNELECSQKNIGNYYIYRVYNCRGKLDEVEFYIIEGNLKEILKLTPISYLVDELINCK